MLTGMVLAGCLVKAEVVSLVAILAFGYFAVLMFTAGLIERLNALYPLLLLQYDSVMPELDPLVDRFARIIILVLFFAALFII
jgi:hypothetical protein